MPCAGALPFFITYVINRMIVNELTKIFSQYAREGEKMKLNSKIMLLVCVCLLVCVSAASATTTQHIQIVKKTNGADGQNIPIGTSITWTYDVKNTGSVPLTDVAVTDDKVAPVSCPHTTLAVGASMQCTASGNAVAGHYTNKGTVTAKSGSHTYSACDDSSYTGIATPQIAIDKVTNGADGQNLIVGTPITWTYTVTNTGNVPLSNVAVTDDKVASVSCPHATLAVGASMQCTASGTAVAGAYTNTGKVSGKYECKEGQEDEHNGGYGTDCVNRCEDKIVTASDGSSYTGIAANPQIGIVKVLTNGLEGTSIAAGTPISWNYTVTNTGNVPLTGVGVTDDKGVKVTCPKSTLAVGESMVCTGSGTAVAESYSNIGTATGFGGIPVKTVTANDVSSYNTAEGGSSSTAVPEFPSLALPAAFIVGLIGVVLFIRGTRENE